MLVPGLCRCAGEYPTIRQPAQGGSGPPFRVGDRPYGRRQEKGPLRGSQRQGGCVLLIGTDATLTTVRRMNELLQAMAIPARNPFDGIYLIGQFAAGERIGYSVQDVRQLA